MADLEAVAVRLDELRREQGRLLVLAVAVLRGVDSPIARYMVDTVERHWEVWRLEHDWARGLVDEPK